MYITRKQLDVLYDKHRKSKIAITKIVLSDGITSEERLRMKSLLDEETGAMNAITEVQNMLLSNQYRKK